MVSLVVVLALGGAARATVVLPSGDPDPAHSTLKLWMSADTGVFSDAGTTPAVNGGTVLQWDNRATAVGAGSDATSGNSPTYHTSGIGGLPVVRFNGTNQYFNGTVTVGGPKTFFLVTDASASGTCCSGGIGTRSSGSSNWNGLHVAKNGADTRFFADRSGSGLWGTTAITNTPTIGVLTYETTGTTIYLNGPVVDGSNASNFQSAGSQYQIATRNNEHSRYLNGDIAELLVYNEVLTPDEINEVGYYLSDKYSIASTFVLPPPPPVLGPNLVTDGSFEINTNSTLGNGQGSELGAHNYAGSTWGNADVTTYWDKNNRVWYVTDNGDVEFPDGDFAYRIDARLDIDGADKLWLWQDDISLTAGQEYQFSFEMWGESGAPILDVELTGSDTIVLFDDTTTNPGDGVAETKSVRFTPTVTGSYSVEFFTDVNNGNNHAWIDDVRLQAVLVVPEPLTMLAVGLAVAGLGGYVRKRHVPSGRRRG